MSTQVVLITGGLTGIGRWLGRMTASAGLFALSLASGLTPRGLYALLARPAYRDRFPWQRLHLFWGDERCVPHDHPDSNYGMVHATVIAHAPSGRRNPDIAVA